MALSFDGGSIAQVLVATLLALSTPIELARMETLARLYKDDVVCYV
jgi:hypothetical protein